MPSELFGASNASLTLSGLSVTLSALYFEVLFLELGGLVPSHAGDAGWFAEPLGSSNISRTVFETLPVIEAFLDGSSLE